MALSRQNQQQMPPNLSNDFFFWPGHRQGWQLRLYEDGYNGYKGPADAVCNANKESWRQLSNCPVDSKHNPGTGILGPRGRRVRFWEDSMV